MCVASACNLSVLHDVLQRVIRTTYPEARVQFVKESLRLQNAVVLQVTGLSAAAKQGVQQFLSVAWRTRCVNMPGSVFQLVCQALARYRGAASGMRLVSSFTSSMHAFFHMYSNLSALSRSLTSVLHSSATLRPCLRVRCRAISFSQELEDVARFLNKHYQAENCGVLTGLGFVTSAGFGPFFNVERQLVMSCADENSLENACSTFTQVSC